MRLKSISIKGFKSFPDRTLLEFAPGVSVVVGPNGSGKSNVTDAVLWAMGEQSPLAVRGQSMQDVIFAGGHGRQAAKSAEVELIFDNEDGSLAVPAGEVAITRRLDRSGEGEYRLNGARCRMTDVLEILSDSGLGKEGHSVVGQGRVEAIVTSKPRDRRLLIEEAAGLGKHRRRRRRAQIKLDRTRENLDRALDVEREARAHLRPLKRQAEAAEIHARLERQTLEARWSLSRDELRERLEALTKAEATAGSARTERERLSTEAARIGKERAEAEDALASRAKQRDELTRRTWAVRNALERIEERLRSLRSSHELISERLEADAASMAEAQATATEGADDPQASRRAELARRLEALDGELAAERAGEMAGLETQLVELQAASTAAAAAVGEAEAARAQAESARAEASQQVAVSRSAHSVAVKERVEAETELASLDEFLRRSGGNSAAGKALAECIEVRGGLETAVAAALGGRLAATVVDDLSAGFGLLDSFGDEGGSAVVASANVPEDSVDSPCFGATRLDEAVSGEGKEVAVARRLLANAWLVDDLNDVSKSFKGIAVTRKGRAWTAVTGDLLQAAPGGAARVFEARNRRSGLVQAVEAAGHAVAEAQRHLAEAEASVAAAEETVRSASEAVRVSRSVADEAAEAQRRCEWQMKARKDSPQAGPVAVQRAEVAAELAAEERIAARMADERDGARQRMQALAERMRLDRDRQPRVASLISALETASAALAPVREQLDRELAGDSEEGDGVASRLRQLAAAEAEVQAKIASTAESVTVAEVESQRLRDRRDECLTEVRQLAAALGLEDGPAEDALPEEERLALVARIERLDKRRAQLGPVNPLAAEEYEAAQAHLEELETQRKDLEDALKELKGLVRDCDRTIRETFEQTFEAASKNFEDLAGQLFPGGSGRLRLVTQESKPRQMLGGEVSEGDDQAREPEAVETDHEESFDDGPEFGVEIEITPAGKTMKRLSLLSGGEKSMTAIAFLFAVFLARPCPFYILDEVEAALDDLNLGRFLDLLRAYRDQAQFIVVTHQRRTMEAADALYGVSMGGDGVSKVVSRRLEAVPNENEGQLAA